MARTLLMSPWKSLWGCNHTTDPWLCKACQERRDAEMSYERDMDVIAERNPELQPGHQWATEAEARERWESYAPLRSPG